MVAHPWRSLAWERRVGLSGRGCAALSLALGCALAVWPVHADEGGASFWLPGQFASFAASPSDPGWSLGAVYYHSDVSSAGARTFQFGGTLAAGIDARADLVFIAPAYTFAPPLLGGQAQLMLTGAFGHMDVGANVLVTGPGGGELGLRRDDSTSGGADLYPMATLRWSAGKHSTMTYLMAGVPVGDYEPGRLANLGLNHWSADAGAGYTYLDEEKGREFSATAGVTYNWQNPDTHYRSGIDSHLDWAASQFLSDKVHVGVAGYLYYQLSADSGSGARLGAYESRIFGAGPEAGYFFGFQKSRGYLQFKTYWEWGALNRPAGWNLWLSLLLPFTG
jgi:hypothetical protein